MDEVHVEIYQIQITGQERNASKFDLLNIILSFKMYQKDTFIFISHICMK